MSLEGNSVLCVCVLAVCSVKAGGPDPVANSKLSDLLKQAKELGVPKDIIDRNIKKASDAKQGDFQECM
jgi:transcriptional/translational regulatory protein YebC/TACO1